jgi:hypothetical protein
MYVLHIAFPFQDLKYCYEIENGPTRPKHVAYKTYGYVSKLNTLVTLLISNVLNKRNKTFS